MRHPVHHDRGILGAQPGHPAVAAALGVETASGIDLWAGLLNDVTSFVVAFASSVRGRVANRRGRKLMPLRSSLANGVFTALIGAVENVCSFLLSRSDRRVRRIFQCNNRTGGEPSPGRAARVCLV